MRTCKMKIWVLHTLPAKRYTWTTTATVVRTCPRIASTTKTRLENKIAIHTLNWRRTYTFTMPETIWRYSLIPIDSSQHHCKSVHNLFMGDYSDYLRRRLLLPHTHVSVYEGSHLDALMCIVTRAFRIAPLKVALATTRKGRGTVLKSIA